MYKLFTKRSDSNNSVIKPPAFELIRRIYQREIATITEYYNSRVYAVPSNHLLCRLLTTGFVSIEHDLSRYLQILYARAPYLAKYFNFTSEISYGKIFDGVFYGPGNDEIILYTEDYFNPFDALENWKSLKPVTVLEHPVSDFGLTLLNGKENSTAKGLSVISINIAMLFIMYRGFLIQQGSKFNSTSQLGTEHFVNMYVLPGMLNSHIEIALLNRLKNLFYAAPMSSSLKKLPFLVVDYTDKIDRVNKEILEHLEDTSRLYVQDLKCIPSFFEEDMQSVLMMPDLAKTRQIWWSLLLARLGTIKFLIDIAGDKGRSANNSYINKLKLDVKQLSRENLIASVLPKDLYYEVKSIFDEILELK